MPQPGLTEYATLPGVVLLWILVVLRGRGVLYGGSARLATVLLTLSVAVTVRLGFVGHHLDVLTGQRAFQVLAQNLVALLTASLAALAVADVARGRPAPAWLVRSTVVVAVATGTVMTACFVVADGTDRVGLMRPGPAAAGNVPLTYGAVYAAAYALFLSVVLVLALRDTFRRAPWTRGRRGLLLFGVAAGLGLLYLTAKGLALAAVSRGAFDHPAVVHAEAFQAVPTGLALLFVAAGAASSTGLELRARWYHWRLRAPWSALTAHVPAVVLDPPLRNPRARLNRRVHEIHEAAALVVGHLAPGDDRLAHLVDDVDTGPLLLAIGRTRAERGDRADGAGADVPAERAPAPVPAVDLPRDAERLVRWFRSDRRAGRAARELVPRR